MGGGGWLPGVGAGCAPTMKPPAIPSLALSIPAVKTGGAGAEGAPPTNTKLGGLDASAAGVAPATTTGKVSKVVE